MPNYTDIVPVIQFNELLIAQEFGECALQPIPITCVG